MTSGKNSTETQRRKGYPLAFGEYIDAGDGSDQTWRARTVLLEAANKVYPKFFETLLQKVYPIYSDIAQTGFEFDVKLFSGRADTSPWQREV